MRPDGRVGIRVDDALDDGGVPRLVPSTESKLPERHALESEVYRRSRHARVPGLVEPVGIGLVVVRAEADARGPEPRRLLVGADGWIRLAGAAESSQEARDHTHPRTGRGYFRM